MKKRIGSRILLDELPFLPEGVPPSPSAAAPWPAKWIGHPEEVLGSAPQALAFHVSVELKAPATLTVHVSADERYEFYVDGERQGRGPERGDPAHWRFESYRLELAKGRHHFAAKVWWLKGAGLSPFAQMSLKPAFLLAAEGPLGEQLSTGLAAWRVMRMPGLEFLPPEFVWGTGAKTRVIAKAFPWEFSTGVGDFWVQPAVLCNAVVADYSPGYASNWLLTPATLPPMQEETRHSGTARHVQAVDTWETSKLPVLHAENLGAEGAAWDKLLAGKEPLAIPAHAWRRVIVDLGEYRCAYPAARFSGGAGARLRIRWAESLYLPKWQMIKGMYEIQLKGDRDGIEGKSFVGIGDEIELDGARSRVFSPLWWEAGRYLEITVRTDAEPLSIEDFHLELTGYPHAFSGRFSSSDERLERIVDISRRTLRMCSHETYMDCPYYEQLMYVGDTRIQALATYVLSGDDRLPRKAISLFNDSRVPTGLTQSRYPCRDPQIIPPFSLWWVAMVHDYALWRGDLAFVKSMMPGVRAVLDHFASKIRPDGLLANPNGWNFLDWVDGWKWGVRADGGHGVSGPLNWHAAMTFQLASELEAMVAEPELAKRCARLARGVAAAADRHFWVEQRGLYADDLDHSLFSEHSQCLALLGGLLPKKREKALAANLFTDPALDRATIYFSHYLFDACQRFGRIDRLFDRLGVWFGHEPLGLTTTLESPEPARSDCHAWSAHPLYHFAASVAGVRPTAPGFAEVEIRPDLGPLTWIDAKIVHPLGNVELHLEKKGESLVGEIALPNGVGGSLRLPARSIPLRPGRNRIKK
ncbi:MAG: alpha-L-rhamnosidase C-terminal domain-containing protein [Phenylobacterium sp.]